MSRVLLFLPLIAGALYFIYTIFKYTRMISNIFLGLVYTPDLEPVSPPAGEPLTILDSTGKEIEALYLEKKGSKKVVIFCPESGASKETWEKYAYFLPQEGFQILSVDFSDAAKDEKNALSQWPSQAEVERLLLVIRWAKNALGRDIRIVLFGISKGANIAFAASFRDPTVKAVIADGLCSMREIFRDYIRKWAPILVRPNFFGERFPGWIVNLFTDLGFWYCQKQCKKKFLDVESMLNKKHAPLFMIHGEFDDYIPPSHQKFLEKISPKKRPVRS